LFQYIFAATKKLRTESNVGKHTLSLAGVAMRLAKQVVPALSQAAVLLVGSGDIIESVLTHLVNVPVKSIFIANRSLEHAERLATHYQATAISFLAIPEYLAQVELVISATACPYFILDKTTMAEALLVRKQPSKLSLIDLAVPRDVEPSIADLPGVSLYCIDDLQKIVQGNSELRQQAADQVKAKIENYVADYYGNAYKKQAAATIVAYRNRVEQLRDQELQKALQRMQQGIDPSQVMSELARNLTNKLIHVPTIKLRQAGGNGATELLFAAKELLDFSLED